MPKNRRRIRTFLLLLFLCCSGFRGSQTSDHLTSIRVMYLEAVESRHATERALEAIEVLQNRGRIAERSLQDATLTGYRGALITLRAKHATWPPSKLRHLREGLATLDSLVAENRDHAEVRYLRLITCYHLPGIFGRQSTVLEDIAALAKLLPSAGQRYPAAQVRAMTQFVLEKGTLTASQRQSLDSLVASIATW